METTGIGCEVERWVSVASDVSGQIQMRDDVVDEAELSEDSEDVMGEDEESGDGDGDGEGEDEAEVDLEDVFRGEISGKRGGPEEGE